MDHHKLGLFFCLFCSPLCDFIFTNVSAEETLNGPGINYNTAASCIVEPLKETMNLGSNQSTECGNTILTNNCLIYFQKNTCYMLSGLELMWDVYTHNIGECFKFHFLRISVLFIMVTLRSEYFFPFKEGLSDPNDGVNQLH